MNQVEYFDSVAQDWDSMCVHDEKKIKMILEFSKIKKGQSVLDIGTGTGILIPHLFSRVGNEGQIFAIDISKNMLSVAKSKYNYSCVNFIHGDIIDADLPLEYFDHAICYSMFPHFLDKQAAVTVISRFLKPGGRLMICHSQSRDAINNLHKKAPDAVCEDNLPAAHIIETFFKNAGLHPIFKIDTDEMFIVAAEK